ncbi:Anaerobic nitric oxide reductase transcription regulator NorR [Labilithrix luteola]|uniref:Anaerobic nitric oxide reductase transcription regulator NorR n=1 Tax=Labilithrix luteola TaxID=1391654 RepID=A0A0K1PZH3_9BACT|nr:sigma 54-interacting transcriptional regulator [Labilithrix luteola]AKU98935.1 Anaerobic nitric oxide reductase transcription regulator NorR [Labilithrix luteola]
MSDDEERTATAVVLRRRDRPSVSATWNGGSVERDLPETGSLLIGRGEECDLVVPYRSLSRKHARLHVGPPHRIEDLGGMNGTHVAGEKLAAGASATIRSGDAVYLGNVVVIVHESAAQTEAASKFIAVDPATKTTSARVDELARGSEHVLLYGETGVGKTTLAERLHRSSPRGHTRLSRVSCMALASEDGARELMGTAAYPGVLERAHGGTLLLEGIDELPLSLQARVLDVMTTSRLARIDGSDPKSVDVRLVTTAGANLDERTKAGKVLPALFARLRTASAFVPSLRERPADVLPLARLVLDQLGLRNGKPALHIPHEVERLLAMHAWPGNVRELKNVVERSALLSRGSAVEAEQVIGAIATPMARLTR